MRTSGDGVPLPRPVCVITAPATSAPSGVSDSQVHSAVAAAGGRYSSFTWRSPSVTRTPIRPPIGVARQNMTSQYITMVIKEKIFSDFWKLFITEKFSAKCFTQHFVLVSVDGENKIRGYFRRVTLPPMRIHLTSSVETLLSESVLSTKFSFISAVSTLATIVIFQTARTVSTKYAIANALPSCERINYLH